MFCSYEPGEVVLMSAGYGGEWRSSKRESAMQQTMGLKLNLTPMHTAKNKLMGLIANVHAALSHVKAVAEHCPNTNRRKTFVDFVVAKITRPLPPGSHKISWLRIGNCRFWIDGTSHSRVAQPRHRDDLHDIDALSVQPHNLLAPFVKLLQRLTSCAFFFHPSLITASPLSSNFIGPYL